MLGANPLEQRINLPRILFRLDEKDQRARKTVIGPEELKKLQPPILVRHRPKLMDHSQREIGVANDIRIFGKAIRDGLIEDSLQLRLSREKITRRLKIIQALFHLLANQRSKSRLGRRFRRRRGRGRDQAATEAQQKREA